MTTSAPGRTPARSSRSTRSRRLRRECPWDREQDERTIVPHTVEEAYELADAASRGDDAKLLDELGDVLFQVHFLSLLLEERGAGDLAEVAEHCRQKLIRRHPHVFGDREVETRPRSCATGTRSRRPRRARARPVRDVPENLPGPALRAQAAAPRVSCARRMRRRGAAGAACARPPTAPAARREAGRPPATGGGRPPTETTASPRLAI